MKEKPEKHAHLKKYRMVTSFQFVYQVTILAMNTIEALRGGLDAQPKEFCSVFTVVMVSIYTLQLFNLTAMSVIYFCPRDHFVC